MANEPIVHVVDDDPAIRDSLAFLLDTADLVSRTYESAAELLAEANSLAPGCIVTDVRMPDMNGLEMVRRLSEMGIRHPVIVMTGHADVPLAIEAVRAGVKDFIEKPFDDEALLSSIRSALADQIGTAERDGHDAEVRDRLASLSTRERQVLEGLVAGQANKVIAFDLEISPRTVEVYRANVMTKMQARSLSELVRMTILAR
ncbi:MAG: response regulator [Alphaproteobacteria bacterium]|jgi:two-component system, LuxR family, response regulator FixJ|nr:response regulator [Alphaproteobacteria bacterium]MBU2040561.1 response regulator [Alphaproteobacteria bacterium]MBU2125250.1 response regulator [Alphaproteobacteria bacterium]MBU2209958.1 response regulator [Alphaproteobacteria bacterium]MBU2290688.1 response regulator [Alphaproteobacteria bacterium]